MKITHKLLLLVACIAGLSWVTIYAAVQVSESKIQAELKNNSEVHALLLIERIIHAMHRYTAEWEVVIRSKEVRTAIKESNQRFLAMPDRAAFIQSVDKEWSRADYQGAEFLTVRDHPVSPQLREIMDHLNEDLGMRLVQEVFITNIYGAVVASTSKTRDFDQSDENWWKDAFGQHYVLGQVYYDQSASVLALPYSMSIEDGGGKNIGVLKLVVSIEEIASILTEGIENSRQRVLLFDAEDNVIFDSAGEKSEEGVIEQLHELDDHIDESHPVYSEQNGDVVQTIVLNTRDENHEEFRWKIFKEEPVSILYRSLNILRDNVFLYSLLGILGCSGFGLMIVWTIKQRLDKVQEISSQLRSGRKGDELTLSGNDEIAELYHALVDLSTSLEKARSEMEELSEIARTTDNGVIITDHRLDIQWFNESLSQVIDGYLDRILNRSLLEVLSDSSLFAIEDTALLERIEKKETCHAQLQCGGVHKGEKWIDIRFQEVDSHSSSSARYLFICSDVTEQREIVFDLERSNAALVELQDRFDRAVRGSNDALWDWNLRDDSVWYSPQFHELLGIEEGDEIPISVETWKEFVHPDDHDRVERSIRHHLKHRTPLDVECRCRRPDGSYQWFRIRGRAYRDEGDVPLVMSGSIQDISVGRAILETLEKERHEGSVIFDNIPSYVFYKDSEDTVLRANKAAGTLTGLTPALMAGKTFAEIFPEMGDAQFQEDKEVFTTRESKINTIEEFIIEGGRRRWVRTDKVLIDDDVNAPHLLVVATDITELKEAEDRVRESDARMELALKAGEMGTWEWNLSDNSIDWDRTKTLLLGIPDSPLHVDSTIFVERVHPDDLIFLGNELRRLIKDQDSSDFNVEFRIFYPTGEMRWLGSKGRGIFNADGWAIGVTGVSYDITELKDKERQLQRTLENQRVLNSLLEISFLEAHLERKLQHCLMIVLGAFEEYSESAGGIFVESVDQDATHIVSVTESMSSQLVDTVSNADGGLEEVFEALRVSTIVTQEANAEELGGELEGGGAFQRIDVPITEGESPLGVLVLYLKISEQLGELERTYLLSVAGTISSLVMRDRAIAAIKFAQELAEQGVRSKSAFLASMSHELRTPLNSILGFTKRLIKRLEESLSERDLDSLLTVDRNAGHLLHLINDILDLSKIEAGKVKLAKREFELIEVIHEILATLSPLAEAKQLELETEYIEEKIYVYADKTKVIQIVTNLVSNAIKYTDSGTIRVSVTILNARVVKISIHDTGIGIRDEDLSRLFTKFTQLEQLEGSRRGGTGLGLTISKEYVELHGGQIHVESIHMHGSTFSVTLPILLSAIQSELQSNSELHVHQEISILCIDDDLDVLKLLKMTFEEEGFHVYLAQADEEAVGVARQLSPHIICMDIARDGNADVDVLRSLREDPHTREIPIVVLTALSELDCDIRESVESIVSKSAKGDELLEALKRVLSRTVGSILLVDALEESAMLVMNYCSKHGITATRTETAAEALRELEVHTYAAMVIDIDTPGFDGEMFLSMLHASGYTKQFPVFVFCPHHNCEDEALAYVADTLVADPEKRPQVLLMSMLKYFIVKSAKEN